MGKVAKAVVGVVLVGLSFVPGMQAFSAGFSRLGWSGFKVRSTGGHRFDCEARRLQ